jgi:hypothetical protein
MSRPITLAMVDSRFRNSSMLLLVSAISGTIIVRAFAAIKNNSSVDDHWNAPPRHRRGVTTPRPIL